MVDLTKITIQQYQERLDKWLEALRSGDYKQTKRALSDNQGGFCCLGVACDLSGLGKWGVNKRGITYLNNEKFLPDQVMKYYGLRNSMGAFSYKDCLASENDRGATFTEIADIIEKLHDILFTWGLKS
jgi:hypothetical protein